MKPKSCPMPIWRKFSKAEQRMYRLLMARFRWQLREIQGIAPFIDKLSRDGITVIAHNLACEAIWAVGKP